MCPKGWECTPKGISAGEVGGAPPPVAAAFRAPDPGSWGVPLEFLSFFHSSQVHHGPVSLLPASPQLPTSYTEIKAGPVDLVSHSAASSQLPTPALSVASVQPGVLPPRTLLRTDSQQAGQARGA